LRRWQARDHHLVDAAAIHVDDFESQAAVFEIVRRAGNAAEASHHETSQRMVGAGFALRNLEIQRRDDFVHRGRAVGEPRAIVATDERALCLAGIAWQDANEPLEQIPDRHQPFDRPELVHHQRQMPV
jgi:hypothetical protein